MNIKLLNKLGFIALFNSPINGNVYTRKIIVSALNYEMFLFKFISDIQKITKSNNFCRHS